MRVFVTGGTGFVGANLVRCLLQAGYSVRALVRPQSRLDNLADLANDPGLEIITGSLLDTNLGQKMRNCQGLFHCAAQYSLWQRDYPSLYQNNVLGTRNILQAAREAGISRTVYTSSVAAIGVKSGGVADETYQSPVEQLIGYYKQSKYWAEQEAHAAVQLGQDVVIVNPSTPVGPWDIKPTPTGDTILRFLKGQMPAYVNTGLNWIDVRDVATGHLLALERGKTGERYILGHENLSLIAVLGKLSHLTGQAVPRFEIPSWLPLGVAWADEKILAKFGKMPTVPLDGVRMSRQVMYYSSTKAVKQLGLPQSPIDRALEDAVNWFQHYHLV
ncbi:MAG: hopanoid-associated sugar epimerase [Microcoleaceae cyanobacterium]